MTFNTGWIPGATFSGSAFSDFVNATPAADPLPSNDLDAARLNDDDSTASSDNANAEVADLNTSNPVVLASDESPPAYQLAALPLGSPENPIEIDDDGTNNDEALLSPRFDAVEIVPF
ncbi:hypothetical protein PGTUg99_023201 [Puccinia graminis f. sp. tritici]|uniref:Uncharacterized protein n=1 Tax=Puccinia graminis f. sp. tritici TaxID=56615 RepID=A0A5B0RJ46_PUCGR|nr:hypothetical protein PGTUg99_023201 [Puccinia graminis f. sp. tritici]